MNLVLLIPIVLAGAVPACINHVNVQCGQDSDCNLKAGGLCAAAAGTINKWCAYPDQNCPNGYRYSTLDVGDGVSGACVPETDAGVDSSLPVAASCVALPNTCGARRDDSCCDSPMISGDTYYRAYDVAGDSNSGSALYPATVSQ